LFCLLQIFLRKILAHKTATFNTPKRWYSLREKNQNHTKNSFKTMIFFSNKSVGIITQNVE
ncbi:hypothetical protein, partial [uncultured Polaribacter sp.]|uniref:hypothetical protein n=1 Tax=uncultured Polaribacter sp. TaxID=174711 RepID=UPI00260196AF